MVREAIPGDLLSTSLPISPGRSDVLPFNVTTEPGVLNGPEVPVAPEVPDTPEVPVEPDLPDIPVAPEAQDAQELPKVAGATELVDTSDLLVARSAPDESELLHIPVALVAQEGTVELDALSETSGVIQLPDEPSIPTVPEPIDLINPPKSSQALESADTESPAAVGAQVMEQEVINLSQLPEELRNTEALPVPNSSSLSIPNNDGVRVLSLESDDLFVFTNRSIPEHPIASEGTLAPAALPVPVREPSRLTREDARILLFGARENRSSPQTEARKLIAPVSGQALLDTPLEIVGPIMPDFNILDDEYLKSKYDYEQGRRPSGNSGSSGAPIVTRQTSSSLTPVSTSAGARKEAISSGRDLSHRSISYTKIIERVAHTGIAKIANPDSSTSNRINIPVMPCHVNTGRQENQETPRGKRNRESPTNS